MRPHSGGVSCCYRAQMDRRTIGSGDPCATSEYCAVRTCDRDFPRACCVCCVSSAWCRLQIVVDLRGHEQSRESMMGLRRRLEFEQDIADSAAGLAVCDALSQSNVDITEVSPELLRELLREEWTRRRFADRPRLRVVTDEPD